MVTSDFLSLHFLGTRGGFPSGGGQMSCARIEGGDGQSFLIDLGSTRLFERPEWITNADHVLMTHLHPDHVAHLPSLIIARLNQPEATDDILFAAPEPIQDYLDFSGMGDIPGWNQTTGIPSEWCGYTLEACQTCHPRKNYAYRISKDSSTLVWTGDCTYSEELAAFCRGADVVVCEATMKDCNRGNTEHWGHMTPTTFAQLMNEARPRVAVTTHYTELEPEIFAEALRPLMDESIDLISARDGFELTIQPDGERVYKPSSG